MRIPGTLNEKQNKKHWKTHKKKAVALLQHGLEADASEWVVNSPNGAPAFILATQGYDVWMGNNRGSQYSLKHKTLNSSYGSADANLYWSFSFEEMGLYDIPAEVDFILRATRQKQISLIGHSQGTTQAFVGLSMKYAYYKEKINLFVALAPIAKFFNTPSIGMR